jgi:hypothetical protein
MMWLLIVREAAPDLPYWRGRRLLAAFDAVLWPVLWVWVFAQAPRPVGLVWPFVTAVAILCALNRLHRAVWVNQRYRFTTWRWGRIGLAMLMFGALLKLLLVR